MSYSDESYRRSPSRSGPFFRPSPTPTPPPPSSTATPTPPPPKTKMAASVKPTAVATKVEKPTGDVNVILLMDVSGSTDKYLKNLLDKVPYLSTEIVNVIPALAGRIQFAFAGVSDHCDGNQWFQPTGFSGDPQVIRDNIGTIKSADGGDTPEAYECAFKEMKEWDLQGTNTIVVAVVDSVPHGIGYSNDGGCPHSVNWKTELDALKNKIKAFYLISCTDSVTLKRLQRLMVADDEHFIELGDGNFIRLTNLVHGIIAKEFGDIEKFLAHLAQTRSQARADEVATLLKTQRTKS